MSDDDTELDERLAPALAVLDEAEARTEQREQWLQRLAEDGWDARALYVAAEAWATNRYGRKT